MFSATMTEKIIQTAKKFMRANPKEIKISAEKNLTLHGLKQFYIDLSEDMKNKTFFSILHKINYDQVIVFCSKVKRAKYLN